MVQHFKPKYNNLAPKPLGCIREFSLNKKNVDYVRKNLGILLAIPKYSGQNVGHDLKFPNSLGSYKTMARL